MSGLFFLFLAVLISFGKPEDAVVSLEASIIRTNNSIENTLPFSLGRDFSNFGKFLKARGLSDVSETLKLELIRLEVKLKHWEKAITNNTDEVLKELDDLHLLENIEAPLTKQWDRVLHFLQNPSETKWNKLVEHCEEENPRFFLKRMELNLRESNAKMMEQIQATYLDEKGMNAIRHAMAGRMLLTISLGHFCGAAVLGNGFDPVSDDDVLYMKSIHAHVLNKLDFQQAKIRSRPRLELEQKEQEGRYLVQGGSGLIKTLASSFDKKVHLFDRVPFIPKNKNYEPRTSNITERVQKAFATKKVLVNLLTGALQIGSYIPTPFSKVISLAGAALSEFDAIREVDEFDDTGDVLRELDILKSELYQMSMKLIEVQQSISEGVQEIIGAMHELHIVKQILGPLDLMIANVKALSTQPTKAARWRLYSQCKKELPRELMVHLKTYTRHERKYLIKEIELKHFDENYVKTFPQQRIQLMQLIVTMHDMCRGVLLKNSLNYEKDGEVAFLRSIFFEIKDQMMKIVNWRKNHFFTDENGVNGVIQKQAGKTEKVENRKLAEVIKNDLHQHYPSYEWIVLVYDGASIANHSYEGYPHLKCYEGASRHVVLPGRKNVFVVRTKEYHTECDNGCVEEYPRKKVEWAFKKATCAFYVFFNTADCKFWTEPNIVFPAYSCHILVREPAGVAATRKSHSMRNPDGISACHYGCWKNTYSLLVSDPQTENIA